MPDFDCLDASYQLIRELREPLVKLRRHDQKLHTRLRSAATSIPVNIADGRGRDGRARRHPWRVARRSAEEVRAILRTAVAFGDLEADESAAADDTLDRLLQMLWRMTH